MKETKQDYLKARCSDFQCRM